MPGCALLFALEDVVQKRGHRLLASAAQKRSDLLSAVSPDSQVGYAANWPGLPNNPLLRLR